MYWILYCAVTVQLRQPAFSAHNLLSLHILSGCQHTQLIANRYNLAWLQNRLFGILLCLRGKGSSQ
jgi:hypothetical protein